MTIQIIRPEVEALQQQQLQTGTFKDAEDLIFQAFQTLPAHERRQNLASATARDMLELFAPQRGLNMIFESDRANDAGRETDL